LNDPLEDLITLVYINYEGRLSKKERGFLLRFSGIGIQAVSGFRCYASFLRASFHLDDDPAYSLKVLGEQGLN